MRLNKKSRKPTQIIPNDFSQGNQFTPAPVQSNMGGQMGHMGMGGQMGMPPMGGQMGVPPQMGAPPSMNAPPPMNQMNAPMPNMTQQPASIPTPSAMAPSPMTPAQVPTPMTHHMTPQMSHQNQMSHPMGIPPANMNSNFSPKIQNQIQEPTGPNSGAAKGTLVTFT